MDFTDIEINITPFDTRPASHRLRLLQALVAGGAFRRAGKTRRVLALFAELL